MSRTRIVIPIPGRIHAEIIDRIRSEHARLITTDDADYLLDLSHVDNLYSAVLSLILFIHAQVTEKKGTAYLVNVAEHLQTALQTMKIDTVLPVYGTMLDFEMEHD